MIVLLCLTSVFTNMPQTAQGAIVIAAVGGMALLDALRMCNTPARLRTGTALIGAMARVLWY